MVSNIHSAFIKDTFWKKNVLQCKWSKVLADQVFRSEGLLKVDLSKTFDLVAWDERTTILVNKQSKLQRAKIY